LPFRYPRACLPVPPVDLKDPTKWLGDEVVKIKTLYSKINGHSSDYFGEYADKETLWWEDKDVVTEKRVNAFWNIPKKEPEIKEV